MIVDNFLPKNYHKEILQLTTSNDFPWYYNESVSGEKKIDSFNNFSKIQYGFAHMIFTEGRENSTFYKYFIPMIYFIEEKMNVEIKELMRIRVGLYTNVGNKETIHFPHVDNYLPHKTFLYYVNDSDGDTIFYNEKFNNITQKSFSVKEKVSPEANKAILFDGLQYHSSSAPIKKIKRITVNINFI